MSQHHHPDDIVRAMRTVPQLRAHHTQRRGWDLAAPHMVPHLGDIRHEHTHWARPCAGTVEYTQQLLDQAGVPDRARVHVFQRGLQTWAAVTLPALGGRDELLQALGGAGHHLTLDVRGWLPIDHPIIAAHHGLDYSAGGVR